MSSSLYLYSETIFINPNVIKYIGSNIAFCKINNKPYKDMYFEGNEKSIYFFIKLLQKILKDSIEIYNDFKCKSCRYCQFIIFQKDDKILKDDKYGKIFIHQLKNKDYLTNNDSVIYFSDINYKFDETELVHEFSILITKFINLYRGYIFYEEYVLGEQYNLQLYNKFFFHHNKSNNFSLDEVSTSIKGWCNKNVNITKIKEYLIILFGNPKKSNRWCD